MEGKEIYLTHHEFDMMLFLARHPGQVFTREQLYEAVWDDIPISVYAKVGMYDLQYPEETQGLY